MFFKCGCVLLALFIFTQKGGAEENAETKIVGGQNAKPGQFKYVVSLRIKRKHFCGGALIKSDTVLTAAHCVFDDPTPEQYEVGVGITNVGDITLNNTLEVTNITIHKQYNPETQEHDIALLMVRPINGTNVNHKGEAIKLNTDTVKDNSNCTVMGWGATNPEYPQASFFLKYVDVPIVPKKNCTEIYAENVIPEKTICAGAIGKDSCQGDSGGPLVCDGKLAGVVSSGFKCATEYPTIYTDVSKYAKWIQGSSASQHQIAVLAIIFASVNFFFMC